MKQFSAAIERSICKCCGIGTMLTRIAPDDRALKCARLSARNAISRHRTRPTDPLEKAKGWLSSELRPPK